MEKLWTTETAAQHLGISEAEVERLMRDGRLTGYRLGGRFLRFKPEQVQALKGTVRPLPDGGGRGPGSGAPAADTSQLAGLLGQVREFVYFYDFYVVSATLLALLVIYLVAAG